MNLKSYEWPSLTRIEPAKEQIAPLGPIENKELPSGYRAKLICFKHKSFDRKQVDKKAPVPDSGQPFDSDS